MSMRVESVGYAAVKGTRHLTRDRVELTGDGVVGDRRWCFVDVAAGQVLRTVQNPALVTAEARVDGDVVTLTAPGLPEASAIPEPTGETVACDYWGRSVPVALLDGPHSELGSRLLDRPVRLAEAPPGEVVYAGAVSVVAVESLAALGDRLGVAVDGQRFRPSLVLRTGVAAFAEEGWVGRDLAVGDAVVRLRRRTPRCAVTALDPATGERDLPMLTALAERPLTESREPGFGLDGDVLRPGVVRPGDGVTWV